MVRYAVFSQYITGDILPAHTGWGIEGRYPDGTVAGRIEDISENREYVELLAEMLNKGGAEAVHLHDIVEDMISRPEPI